MVFERESNRATQEEGRKEQAGGRRRRRRRSSRFSKTRTQPGGGWEIEFVQVLCSGPGMFSKNIWYTCFTQTLALSYIIIKLGGFAMFKCLFGSFLKNVKCHLKHGFGHG